MRFSSVVVAAAAAAVASCALLGGAAALVAPGRPAKKPQGGEQQQQQQQQQAAPQVADEVELRRVQIFNALDLDGDLIVTRAEYFTTLDEDDQYRALFVRARAVARLHQFNGDNDYNGSSSNADCRVHPPAD